MQNQFKDLIMLKLFVIDFLILIVSLKSRIYLSSKILTIIYKYLVE